MIFQKSVQKVAAVVALCAAMGAGAAIAATDRIEPARTEDGLYTQSWFLDSFMDIGDDIEESAAEGKRLVLIFEQKGCIYCKKIHTEVLSDPKVNAYIRENFNVIQMNLWGDREVTDLDGVAMSEKKIARRWGVTFTPTIIFLPESREGLDDKTTSEAAVAKMPGAFGKITFLSMFEWVKAKGYESDEHFQKYVMRKLEEREAAKK